MKAVQVTIAGTTPLICNRFDDSGETAKRNGADKGTPLEQSEKKLYRGSDDKPMIPQPNLLRCLVDGGKFHKVGKKQVTTKAESLLYSCMDIEGAEIKINNKEHWRVDTRAVRIPATGGRILAHRPMFDDWELTFTIQIDTDFVNTKLLRQIVDDAGKRIGLGDFRPACKGPYGKFVVTNWVEE